MYIIPNYKLCLPSGIYPYMAKMMLQAITPSRATTTTTLKHSLHYRRLFPKLDVLYIHVFLHEQDFQQNFAEESLNHARCSAQRQKTQSS